MSERMSNEKAREEIKMLYAFLYDGLSEKQKQALDIAIESLDNEWTDVRDRLPSENCNVLVTVFNKRFNSYKVEYMWFDKDEKIFDYELEYEDFSLYDEEDVIAWRPLPKPYERKE